LHHRKGEAPDGGDADQRELREVRSLAWDDHNPNPSGMNITMGEERELEDLRRAAREDRKLIRRAERALAEIDRGPGLSDEHADVLAALRIRLEGRKRASLDELISAAGDLSGKRDLGDALQQTDTKKSPSDWPVIEEKPRDWPGL
jgi:hypothetical protein